MLIVERPATKPINFYWDLFAAPMPKWVVPTIKRLGFYFMFVFVLFAIQARLGTAEIQNGQYVLTDHGTFIRYSTEEEYTNFKRAELWMFSALWVFFYFVQAAYWWFPRRGFMVLPTTSEEGTN